MQGSGNFSEVVERLHNSLIGLDKTFAPSFRKRPDRLSIPAAFETWVAFKIELSFPKQMPNENNHLGSYVHNI